MATLRFSRKGCLFMSSTIPSRFFFFPPSTNPMNLFKGMFLMVSISSSLIISNMCSWSLGVSMNSKDPLG